MSRTCTVCENPLVNQVDELLASGTSIRAVARLHDLARSTVARHRQHVRPLERAFGVIHTPSDPPGPVDPLGAAFELAAAASTPRERLKALEAVRSATALQLRGLTSRPGAADLELLDQNVRSAEQAYKDPSASFEHATRALQGLREAIRQKLDASKLTPQSVEVPMNIRTADGTKIGELVVSQRPSVHFDGIPARFHDAERYTVQRTIRLRFGEANADESIRVYEIATGGLAWKK